MAGKQLLDATGKRILDSSGKIRLESGSGCCCGVTCCSCEQANTSAVLTHVIDFWASRRGNSAQFPCNNDCPFNAICGNCSFCCTAAYNHFLEETYSGNCDPSCVLDMAIYPGALGSRRDSHFYRGLNTTLHLAYKSCTAIFNGFAHTFESEINVTGVQSHTVTQAGSLPSFHRTCTVCPDDPVTETYVVRSTVTCQIDGEGEIVWTVSFPTFHDPDTLAVVTPFGVSGGCSPFLGVCLFDIPNQMVGTADDFPLTYLHDSGCYTAESQVAPTCTTSTGTAASCACGFYLSREYTFWEASWTSLC